MISTIKSKIKNPSPYPKLRQFTEMDYIKVGLFRSPHEGTIIAVRGEDIPDDPSNQIGYSSTSWMGSAWEDFEGEITLRSGD